MKSYTEYVNERARADGGANIKTVHTNINSGEPKMGTGPDSLRVTDDLSKKVQKSEHRVALDDMLKKIVSEEYIHPTNSPHMTIAVIQLENGFLLVGKSAPADPENFDAETGEKFAREDAIRQLWQLEGYALREKLHASQEV